MAKQAKLPQTDWTRGGRDISNTAVPLYQENLQRIGDYLSDPQAAMDSYLNKYYGANAIQNQDFLRMYNRQMANQIGANYAATGGGYNSSGQRAVYDRQMLLNDLAARLNQYGIQSSNQMANQDYNNMLNANQAYYNAYGLGKNYSAIETQNAMADAANRNWWSSALSGIGAGLSSIHKPYTMAIGAGLQTAGGITGQDFGSANNTYGSVYGGNMGVQNNNTFQNLAQQLGQFDWGKVFNKGTGNTTNTNPNFNTNVGNQWGLNTNASNVTNAKFSWQQ